MSKLRYHLLTLVLISFTAGIPSCDDSPNQPGAVSVQIRVADLFSTGVVLRLTTTFRDDGSTLRVTRTTENGDRDTILQGSFLPMDTLLYDEELAPLSHYRYVATRTLMNSPIDSSLTDVITLDTTSQNWSFDVDTLGDLGSSQLRDVTITDDGTILAVGEIYQSDSVDGSFEPFGVAIWTGTSWHLRRLSALNPFAGVSRIWPSGVLEISPGNIWLAQGSIFNWDGGSDTVSPYWIVDVPGNPDGILGPGQAVWRLWGTASDNVYAVGRAGALVRFDGIGWKKLESGTVDDINDIWGTVDADGNTTLHCVVSTRFSLGFRGILRIDARGQVQSLEWSPQRELNTLWSMSEHWLYLGGDGMFQGIPPMWNQVVDLPSKYKRRIRGTNHNNVFVVGDFGLVAHLNGLSWTTFEELSMAQGSYTSLVARDNMVVGVGYAGNRAAALRGHR